MKFFCWKYFLLSRPGDNCKLSKRELFNRFYAVFGLAGEGLLVPLMKIWLGSFWAMMLFICSAICAKSSFLLLFCIYLIFCTFLSLSSIICLAFFQISSICCDDVWPGVPVIELKNFDLKTSGLRRMGCCGLMSDFEESCCLIFWLCLYRARIRFLSLSYFGSRYIKSYTNFQF